MKSKVLLPEIKKGEKDAETCVEIQERLGLGEKAVRRILKVHQRSGKLKVGKAPRVCIDGKIQMITVYWIE